MLFWISFRSVKLNEIESHNRNRDRPRRNISKQSGIGNVINTNPSSLKMRLTTNVKGSGDVRWSFKVGKKLWIHYTVISRVFWHRMEF